MNSYMSMQEKRAFIDKDFKENVLDKIGRLPANQQEAIAYISNLRDYADMWITRYEHKSQGKYAMLLLDDFIETVTKDFYRRFVK